MRLRPLQWVGFAGLMTVVLAPHFACTVIGALVGGAIDARSQGRVIPTGEAVTVPRGTRLVLTLRDGRRVSGVYRDTVSLGDPDHDALWRRWLAQPKHAASPTPGDEVTVVDESGEWRAVFAGYHYRSIEVAPMGADIRRVPMASLRSLRDTTGHEWSGSMLAALDASGSLPSRLAIVIGNDAVSRGITRTTGRSQMVSMSEIQQITFEHGHTAQTVGIIVGLAADVTIVAAAAALSSMDSYGCAGTDLSGIGWFTAIPPGVQLTSQPYDRLAGTFLPEAAGHTASGSRAAPAP